MIFKNSKIPTFLFTLFVSLSLMGCVGYQLGSMLPKDLKTVYIPNATNISKEPNIESEVTRSVVEQVQRDGSLKVVNDVALADATLEVEIRTFRLEPVAFDGDRASQTDEYRIWITARAVLIRNATKEIVAENVNLVGRTEFLFTSDLTTAKRQNLDEAADDLANEIVQMMVEVWE